MRHSSFPPELRKFVKSVEKNAQEAGHSSARARILGAWSACFVRFCTVNDHSWREPEHVPGFVRYLENRQDVDQSSREQAIDAMVFLFENLLKVDVSDAEWHPDQQSAEDTSEEPADAEEEGSEEGEQSTLLTRLLFHTSLPINEALDLCAGDVDLDAGLIYVSDPMGTPKRIVELPDALYDPMRRHLERIRREHGRRYFDAPLFQAQALHGRVQDEDDDTKTEEAEQESEPVTASASSEESKSSDGPESLWGYAEES